MTATWSLRFADDHGIAGVVRLTVAGGAAPSGAAYEARLTIPGFGHLVVADDDLPAPRPGSLEVRGEALWAEFVCETPGEHWGVALEAFGLRFDDADEARASDRGERLAVGLDLEWEAPDRVVGEILAGARRWAVEGRGALEG